MMNDKHLRQTNQTSPKISPAAIKKNNQNFCLRPAKAKIHLRRAKRFSRTPDIPYMGHFCLKIVSQILNENML